MKTIIQNNIYKKVNKTININIPRNYLSPVLPLFFVELEDNDGQWRDCCHGWPSQWCRRCMIRLQRIHNF
jgi:hypothetical protein